MPERQVPCLSPSTPALPHRAAGPALHPHSGGRQQVPSPSASSYTLSFTGISLMFERGQGCRFLRDNLVTDVLGLGTPIPLHKYFFWKEMGRGGRQRWHPAGTTGVSALVLLFAIPSLDLKLTPHWPCCCSASCPSSISPISLSPTSGRKQR